MSSEASPLGPGLGELDPGESGPEEPNQRELRHKAPVVPGDTFRLALGRFASGVTVVTGAAADGAPVGVTVSAFSSLSLDPPMVLICLDKRTGCLAAFEPGRRFTVNILAAGQEPLSNAFAGAQCPDFHGFGFERAEHGGFHLAGVVAAIDAEAGPWADGGDHVIIPGHVTAVQVDAEKSPLLYFSGRYARLDAGSAA